jgi:hypothetical protein
MNNLQILHLTKIKTIFFVFAFTAMSVATPMVAHYFGGPTVGRMFLPMHFFVMAGALLLGWRAGMVIGILTPLISYSITGMPFLPVLPFLIIEVAAYGLFAGLLQEKTKNIFISLIGAMVLGRLFLWLGIFILPTKLVASQYLIGAVQGGWRGIVLQILLVPVAVVFAQKFLKDERI